MKDPNLINGLRLGSELDDIGNAFPDGLGIIAYSGASRRDANGIVDLAGRNFYKTPDGKDMDPEAIHEDVFHRIVQLGLTLEALNLAPAEVAAIQDEKVRKFIQSAQDLFKNKSDLQNVPEVLGEMSIRSAIADSAWSAAFVSYIVRIANTGKKFEYSSGHRRYIRAAVQASKNENLHTDALYRACDPKKAELIPGDLVCYTRDGQSAEALRKTLYDREGEGVAHAHCDIVVGFGNNDKTVFVAGGNVVQSISIKQLQLLSNKRLDEDQSKYCIKRSDTFKPTLPLKMPTNVRHAAGGCSLNDKRWFAVLQVR